MVAAVLVAGCAPALASSPAPLRIGTIFPPSGGAAADAGDEYRGALIAAELVNSAGGVQGRPVSLDVRNVNSSIRSAQPLGGCRVTRSLPSSSAPYSSQLSIPAAAAVAKAGMVYWEPAARRPGDGTGFAGWCLGGCERRDLGGNSGSFCPCNGWYPGSALIRRSLSAFLVTADDAYAHSVAAGARAALTTGGLPIS